MNYVMKNGMRCMSFYVPSAKFNINTSAESNTCLFQSGYHFPLSALKELSASELSFRGQSQWRVDSTCCRTGSCECYLNINVVNSIFTLGTNISRLFCGLYAAFSFVRAQLRWKEYVYVCITLYYVHVSYRSELWLFSIQYSTYRLIDKMLSI